METLCTTMVSSKLVVKQPLEFLTIGSGLNKVHATETKVHLYCSFHRNQGTFLLQ
eukprot:c31147_g1_i1 orf=85-249(+)